MNNYMKIIINAIKQWANEKLADLNANLDNKITVLNDELSNKVDVVEGKDLSTEDYTTEEKYKLAGIESGAQVADATGETVTASEFNSLLNALRDANVIRS